MCQIEEGKTEMVDWLWLSLGLAGLVLGASAYSLSVKTLNIDSEVSRMVSRIMKISCVVTTVVGIMLIVLAFWH